MAESFFEVTKQIRSDGVVPGFAYQQPLEPHRMLNYSALGDIVSNIASKQTSDFVDEEQIKKQLFAEDDRDTAIVLAALYGSQDEIRDCSDDETGDETRVHVNDLKAVAKRSFEMATVHDVMRQGIDYSLNYHSPFHHNIHEHRKSFSRTTPSLYGDIAETKIEEQFISPFQVVQAVGADNCHFAAGVSSLAAMNPAAIPKLIRENADGSKVVRFPGLSPIPLDSPTPGKLLYYGQLTQNFKPVSWPFVLQEGYGTYNDRQRGVLGASGSRTFDGLRKLTGGEVDVDENWCTSYETMNRKLTAAKQYGRPVVAGLNGELFFGDDIENRTGLACHHAYAVIDFEANKAAPKEATITVRDQRDVVPWKTPPEGIKDLGHAAFSMSLETFSKIFSTLAYAEQAPYERQERTTPRRMLGRERSDVRKIQK